MGQREEVVAVGAGTVRIGRRVDEEIGGPGLVGLVAEVVGVVGGREGCGGEEERDTVLMA